MRICLTEKFLRGKPGAECVGIFDPDLYEFSYWYMLCEASNRHIVKRLLDCAFICRYRCLNS